MRGIWSTTTIGVLALMLASCGDGGASTPTPTPISITSATTATLAENSTATAYQVTTAGGSGTTSYALSGADAGAFAISSSGALTFKTAPDYEQPASSAKTNSYAVTITATDNTGSASVNLTVNVTNVPDLTSIVKLGGAYARADHIAPVPGQSKLFVAQRNGTIYLVDPTAAAQSTLYLTVTGIYDVNDTSSSAGTSSSPGSMRGLMAVAAAPDYATSGVIYAYVSTNTSLEVRRYTRTSAGLGDASSAHVILRVPFPADTPNVGGWMGFGSDGLLYITVGSANSGRTTPATSLLGKLLRIDPSRDDFPADTSRDYGIPSGNPFANGNGNGAGEVYASGFVNPNRAGIDGSNVYVADEATLSNYMAYDPSYLFLVRPADAGKAFAPSGFNGTIPQVLTVDTHLMTKGDIIGGNVYRGSSPDLLGRYVFWASGNVGTNNSTAIFSIPATNLVQGSTVSIPSCCTYVTPRNSTTDPTPVAFGEDTGHNLYFTDGTSLYEFVYT